jgi:hypothetical protein
LDSFLFVVKVKFREREIFDLTFQSSSTNFLSVGILLPDLGGGRGEKSIGYLRSQHLLQLTVPLPGIRHKRGWESKMRNQKMPQKKNSPK